MRYISAIENLRLYSADGKSVVYEFEGGEYFGTIDAYNETDKAFTLQTRLDKKDLLGKVEGENGFVPEEACGLGSLTGKNNAATPVALDADAYLAFVKGLRGVFFAANPIEVKTTDSKTTIKIGKYEVVAGTFKGHAVGEIVTLAADYETVAGTDAFIIKAWVPCVIDGECSCGEFKEEYFRIIHLMNKDDATNYWLYNGIGYSNPDGFYKHIHTPD